MAKKIDVKKVLEIAKLAHIDVSEKEAIIYAKQIADILSYVEKLSKVNTEGAEFKSQTLLTNVFREDIAKDSLPIEKVLSNRKSKSKNNSLVISSVL